MLVAVLLELVEVLVLLLVVTELVLPVVLLDALLAELEELIPLVVLALVLLVLLVVFCATGVTSSHPSCMLFIPRQGMIQWILNVPAIFAVNWTAESGLCWLMT